MKITKATVKRINDHSYVLKMESIIPAIALIGEILCQSGLIIGEPGHYEINNGQDEYVTPLVHNEGDRGHEFISGTVRYDCDKRILRGLYTRYPNWIYCTFTHGLNGVDIYDPNKLVKAILDEG